MGNQTVGSKYNIPTYKTNTPKRIPWEEDVFAVCRPKDNMSHINPWRYRGKYTDRGTGLLYLNTRYYDPATRRFINADNYKLLPILSQRVGGLNMYAFANNNPITYQDPSGQLAISTLIILGLIGLGAAAGGTYFGVTAYNSGARGWELAGNIAFGAFAGAALTSFAIGTGFAGVSAIGVITGKSFTFFGMPVMQAAAIAFLPSVIIGSTVGPITGVAFPVVGFGSVPGKPNTPPNIDLPRPPVVQPSRISGIHYYMFA